MENSNVAESDKIRAVIDTSVIVSAHLTSNNESSPYRVWQALVDGEFSPIISSKIMEEIVSISARKNFDEEKIIYLIKAIEAKAEYTKGIYSIDVLDSIDPDDNMILEAAYEGDADYIVSLDKKSLLPIKYFYGTQIVSPSIFLRRLEENRKKINSILEMPSPKLKSISIECNKCRSRNS